MRTPGELISYFETLAMEHKEINDFHHGDYDEILSAERSTIEYPVLWLESPEILFPYDEDNIIQAFNLAFVVFKNSPTDDQSRERMNLEHTFRIARDIVFRLLKDSYDDVFDFTIKNISMDPVNAINNDNDQGYRVEFEIQSSPDECYNAEKWDSFFPAGTVPRFTFKEVAGNMVFTNDSDPAGSGFTVTWKINKDGVESTASGSPVTITGPFTSLYVEMQITNDATHFKTASTYITANISGVSIPFSYNPIL